MERVARVIITVSDKAIAELPEMGMTLDELFEECVRETIVAYRSFDPFMRDHVNVEFVEFEEGS